MLCCKPSYFEAILIYITTKNNRFVYIFDIVYKKEPHTVHLQLLIQLPVEYIFPQEKHFFLTGISLVWLVFGLLLRIIAVSFISGATSFILLLNGKTFIPVTDIA